MTTIDWDKWVGTVHEKPIQTRRHFSVGLTGEEIGPFMKALFASRYDVRDLEVHYMAQNDMFLVDWDEEESK